jgi:hypothetical protein
MVLSDVPWRTKLARRIIPLPAALRVCLLVLIGCLFGSIAAQAGSVSSPATGPRLTFAIDDFDMDGRPNLATVEPVSNSPSLAIYRIQVQLGDGRRQSTEILAPSGGLRLTARDVDGNGIPDLILSLAWREGPFAVLLNDGHASFSLADPSSFPRVSGGSGETLNGTSPPQTDTVATPPKLPVGDLSGLEYLLQPRPDTSSITRANFATLCSLLLESLLGRAPPTLSCA